MAGITEFILSLFKGNNPFIPIKGLTTEHKPSISSKYKPIGGIDTKKFEGLRLHVYKDTVGKSTIGYGHNLQGGNDKHLIQLGINKLQLLSGSRDLTLEEANKLFDLDYADALNTARSLCPKLDDMPPVVKSIVADLAFNMGYTTLSTFRRTIACFNEGRWEDAAVALKASKWYGQVGLRSKAIVNALYDV